MGTDARELRTSTSPAERNGGVSLTQVGSHAGALVFMIGTLAGLVGGFLALMVFRLAGGAD